MSAETEIPDRFVKLDEVKRRVGLGKTMNPPIAWYVPMIIACRAGLQMVPDRVEGRRRSQSAIDGWVGDRDCVGVPLW